MIFVMVAVIAATAVEAAKTHEFSELLLNHLRMAKLVAKTYLAESSLPFQPSADYP